MRDELSLMISRVLRRQGWRLKLPKDLAVFFPASDGRQDLMYEQDFGLKPHATVYLEARRLVLAAGLPEGERDLLCGYLDLFIGEYQRAARALEGVCRQRPEEFWPHFLRACALWLWGDERRTRRYLGDALEAIEKAISKEPASLYSYVIRAGLRREIEDVPGRLSDAERVIRMAPDFVWARTEKAEVLGETGHYRPALREINALIGRFPGQAWAWAQRGRLRGISGYYRLALQDFEKAVALDERCGPLWAWRGETRRRLGRYREALEDLDRSISLDPGYRLAHAWRGRIHLLLGDFRRAVADFDETLRLEPREMLARAWRAEAWWKLGEYRKAVEDFDAIYPAEAQGLWNARLRPHETQENYFMLDAEGGKRREAFWSDVEDGARSSRDPWAWAFLGQAQVCAGRIEEGLGSLTRALQLAPENSWARAWRGEGARRLGAYTRALSDLSQSLRRDPAHRWAWAWRGRVLFEMGRLAESLDSFARALDGEEQRLALAHVWRGETLRALGRGPEAEASVRRALILDGKCKPAAAWLKRLEPCGVTVP